METWLRVINQINIVIESIPGGITTVALVLVFVAVFLGVVGAASLLRKDPVQRRLAGDAPR